MPTIYSEDTERAVVAAYQAGKKLRVIAEENGVGMGSIGKILRRYDCPRQRWAVTTEDLEHADRFCAEERQRGVVVFPDHTKPKRGFGKAVDETAFDVATPIAAYWIGLLMADGCITDKNAVVVVLSEPDCYAVEALRDFLKSDHAISRVEHKGPAKPAARLSIKSPRLASVLGCYGITPRKSLTVQCRHVENHPDFWRGYFDGNGTIYSANGHIALSGSVHITAQFMDFVRRLVPRATVNQVDHHTTESIRVAYASGRTAAIVMRALYSSDGPHLVRKKNRAREILARHDLDLP